MEDTSGATPSHIYAERYPWRMEYELRKSLLAGEEQQTLRNAELFLNELGTAFGGDLVSLKSGVMQAIIILYHKSFQVGVPVEHLISRLVFVARRIELIETWEGLKRLFRDVIKQILEKNRFPAEESLSCRVSNYIQAHFHRDVTLSELAEAVRLEPMQLRKIFVREMGLDFSDYLAQTRIQEAKELLYVGFSVSDIAEQVGYKDASYFIRVFKRLVGTTPGQFARQEARASSTRSSAQAVSQDAQEGRSKEEICPSGQGSPARGIYPWPAERNLRTAILSGNFQETEKAADNFLAASLNQVGEVNALKSYVIKAVVGLSRKCLQRGVPVEDYLVGTLDLCRQVDSLQTYSQIRDFLKHAVQELCRHVVLNKDETIRAVEILKGYMQENYSQPIKLEELAEMVNYSPYYLVRVFNRLTGSTPYEYLINTRMEVARELISRTNLPLKAIANLVGYQDISHFVNTFKKKTGETPKKYAKLRDPYLKS